MNDDEIEKLKKRLYKKEETFKERETRVPLSPRSSETKAYWEEPPKEEGPGLVLPEEPKKSPAKRIIAIFSIFFGLAILGAGFYFLIGGSNVVSSKNIEIKMEGPTSIKGGEAGKWQVLITNKNKTDLELADFIIEYPENSRPVSDAINTANGSKNISERRAIGSVKAGETINQTIETYLFGEKDTDKIFKLALEYRPQGSNAILEKTAEQAVRLLQSPVEISLKLPQETNSGEPVILEAEIFSNAETVIKDMNFKMEYPNGFRFQSADLKPTAGDNLWRLGDIESGKKRTLKITGVLEGQDLMEMAFRALAGPLDEKGEVVPYGFSVESIILKKPFLKLGVAVNNKDGEIISSPGEEMNISVKWQNTLSEKISNAVIEVKLGGLAVDQRSLSVSNGFYRSFDQTLVWNQSSFPELSSIDPLVGGEAQFRFSLLNPLPNEAIRSGNPSISLDIEMRADRISEGEGAVQIKNHLSKEIKIATQFQMSRRGLYYSGPFKNSGPLPPKVGKETTYTVVWQLTNSTNAVSDATVSAYLPSYVRWLGVIKPENSDVSYNQNTGEIIWKAGTVAGGAGSSFLAQELSFQISYLPSASQIGSQPVLVSEATVGGKDTFTGAYLRSVKSALTTYLDTDSQFKYNEATVAP